MGHRPRMGRGIQLKRAEWSDIPQNSGRWFEYNSTKQQRLARDQILRQVTPVIMRIISDDLTAKQQQVMALYFLDQKTQVETARELGITQPTVSQQLNGRWRRGKRIGGALRKIRKMIQVRAIEQGWCPEGDEVVAVLVSLLDSGITRRKAAELLASLPV